jgi:hypothetical protein
VELDEELDTRTLLACLGVRRKEGEVGFGNLVKKWELSKRCELVRG